MLNKTLIIVGCGGHARSIADIAIDNNYSLCFLDTNAVPNETIYDIPCYNKLPHTLDITNTSFIIGIGDNATRALEFKKYNSLLPADTIVANTTWQGKCSEIGPGTFIANRTHIGPGARIGENVIINTHAVIEHETYIGNHTHIAVNAIICGRSEIGDYCFIGGNATIIDKIKICSHVIIGAGAVVIDDITESGTYVGVPARKLIR